MKVRYVSFVVWAQEAHANADVVAASTFFVSGLKLHMKRFHQCDRVARRSQLQV